MIKWLKKVLEQVEQSGEFRKSHGFIVSLLKVAFKTRERQHLPYRITI